MDPINYDEDDMDEAAEYSLNRYDGEARIEGTVEDMLDNLDTHE